MKKPRVEGSGDVGLYEEGCFVWSIRSAGDRFSAGDHVNGSWRGKAPDERVMQMPKG